MSRTDSCTNAHLRYNAHPEYGYVRDVLSLENISEDEGEPLNAMDASENMGRLREVGNLAGENHVHEEDFPAPFHLRDS